MIYLIYHLIEIIFFDFPPQNHVFFIEGSDEKKSGFSAILLDFGVEFLAKGNSFLSLSTKHTKMSLPASGYFNLKPPSFLSYPAIIRRSIPQGSPLL